MIATERTFHPRTNFDLAVDHYWNIFCRANSQDTRFWWIDDGDEVFNLIGAQVTDSEGTAFNIFRSDFPRTRRRDHLLVALGQARDGGMVSIFSDDVKQATAIQRDGNTDIDMLEMDDLVTIKMAVQVRELPQRQSYCLHNHVVDADFLVIWQSGIDFFAHCQCGGHINFGCNVEVRYRRFAFQH